MSILVTGGAGYIGSHTAKELIERGEQVIIYDDLSTGFHQAARDGMLVVGSLHHYDKLCETMRAFNVDSVIHFAAYSQVGESMVNQTKLMIEKIMQDYDVAYGLRSISLRYFNAAGADESGTIGEAHNPETHLIPIIMQVLLGRKEHISIYGTDYSTSDGTCIRDYIHVTDLATAHILAMEALNKGAATTAYNLGNGNGFSVREVITMVEKVTSKKIATHEGARRSGDPAILIASAEKITNELGWKPQFESLEQIIVSAWNLHSKHPYGY